MGKSRIPSKWSTFFSGGTFFTIQTIIGVAAGIGLGFGLKEAHSPWTEREVMYLKYPGDMFIRALQTMILPLIVSSLIDAVGSLDLTLSKKIGLRAMIFYLGTTAIAAVLGVILCVIIRPGNHSTEDLGSTCGQSDSATVDALLDLGRNMLPANLIGATIEVTKTVVNSSDTTIPFDMRPFIISSTPGTNMMGLVIFSIVFGFTFSSMGEAGKPGLYFFKSVGEASMHIITKMVFFSPIAVCFLIAGQLVAQEDILSVFENMGWFTMTVIIGLVIHGCIILPVLYILLARANPLTFTKNMTECLVLAFGTASSSASLPVTMRCLEEKNGVDVRVSRFVLPIGATVNMNATALYLPVAAIFISQLCGRDLGIGSLVTMCLISITSAVGTAGVPQGGLIMLLTVISSVGLPVEHVSYVLPIEWLLERLRTALNVFGDSIGADIVAKMSKEDLKLIEVNASSSAAPSTSSLELESSSEADLNSVKASWK